MKSKLLALCVIGGLVGCAGVSTPGPNGEPSPFQQGLNEAARSYDESPWETFGPYGAAVAGLLAAIAGVKKGTAVYKARKPTP
jgi:hypothetical protein